MVDNRIAVGRQDSDPDSSDIDVGPIVPNKYATRGRSSINAMMKFEATLRNDTKIAVKKLEDLCGGPDTIAAKRMWLNRFDAFMHVILEKGPDHHPSDEDFERFFLGFIPTMTTVGPVSYGYAWSGLLYIVQGLAFRLRGFQLEPGTSIRMKGVFGKLLEQNVLTKIPVERSCGLAAPWSGDWWKQSCCQPIFMVGGDLTATAIDCISIIDALLGTLNWTVTVMRVLQIVLQAAVAARAGDLGQSTAYTGQEYVQWADISLKWSADLAGAIPWEALITLRHTKNLKNDGRRNLTHRLGMIETCPHICPISWIIVHALRTGAVDCRSIRELEAQARSSRGNYVRWLHPTGPVFGRIGRGHGSLDLTPSAVASGFNINLQYAADLLGMNRVPTSHDLRRGAASELAHAAPMCGADVTNAARVLGHSILKSSRTTSNYVGHMQADPWKSRVEDPMSDPFGPEFRPLPSADETERLTPTSTTSVN